MTTKQTREALAASPFRDLTEVLGAEPKVLPIKGRLWEFPARIPDALGAKLAQISAAVRKAPVEERQALGERLHNQMFTEAESEALVDAVLGEGVQDELIEAQVVGEALQHVVGTLVTWHTAGQDAAVAVWEGQKPGEAPALNRAARRAGSASADKTRRRASSSGTSPRKAQPRAPRKAAAARSGGATSSSTGR